MGMPDRKVFKRYMQGGHPDGCSILDAHAQGISGSSWDVSMDFTAKTLKGDYRE